VSRAGELADELVRVGEQLDELSLEVLLHAREEGATRRPDADRVLMQARRAVEKAAHLLRSLSDP
jgi:hypothetical protein